MPYILHLLEKGTKHNTNVYCRIPLKDLTTLGNIQAKLSQTCCTEEPATLWLKWTYHPLASDYCVQTTLGLLTMCICNVRIHLNCGKKLKNGLGQFMIATLKWRTRNRLVALNLIRLLKWWLIVWKMSDIFEKKNRHNNVHNKCKI